MTQEEIFRMQGELSVLNKEIDELEISGSNSLLLINNLLNPINIDNSIAELEIIKITVELKHLTDICTKIKGLKNKAGKISDILNKIKESLI